jgi:hypothetical protein
MATMVVLVLLALVLAACGGDGGGGDGRSPEADGAASSNTSDPTSDRASEDEDTAPSGSLPDPCGLLTDAEINAELVDFHAETREPTPFPRGGGQCEIHVVSTDGGSSYYFEVAVAPVAGFEAFLPPGKRKAIDGIGDDAFEVSGNYYAIEGTSYVHLVNFPSEDASVRLLKAAAARL